METGVDTCAATVSQHLAKMYYVGILNRKRKQTQIFYSLVDREGVVDMLKTYLMS
jgi:DNA-binding transcriptional ArsR family regulator